MYVYILDHHKGQLVVSLWY